MDDKKKVTLGEKLLNSMKQKKQLAGEVFIKSVNRDNDDRLQYAGENNIVDFEDALRSAGTTVDPRSRREASDREDGPEHEKPVLGRRSIDERIAKANKRLEKEGREFSAAIDERVVETEKMICRFMDEKGTDILTSEGLIRGFHVVMQRSPDPDKEKSIDDLEVMTGGKKVAVFRELEGESVRTDSPVPEISSGIVKRAAGEMASSGSMKWEKDIETGDAVSRVSLKAEASVGRNPVSVIVRDDKELAGRSNGTDMVNIPAGKYISPSVWNDEFYRNMVLNKSGAYSTTYMDGTVIQCRITAQCNGRGMSIDGFLDDPKASVLYPGRAWEGIYKDMLSAGRQMFSYTDEKGDIYDFKMNVLIDGKEAKIDYDGALCGKAYGDVPPTVILSKSAWEEGIEKAANDPSLSGQSQVDMPDGRKLNLKVKAAVDGKEAIPNIPVAGDEVRQFKGGGIMIGRGFAQKAVDEMEKSRSTFCRLTAKDGREFRFTREGRLTLFINGKEFSRFAKDPGRRKSYKAALSEVAGLMNSPEEEKKGMEVRAREAQKTIAKQRFLGQLPYTGAGYAVRGASSEIRRADMTSTSILSALLRGAMGAARSVGR